jgi:hypothetical protein
VPLIIAILAALFVVALTIGFVRNALALKRDINRRFDDLRVRLESEANATLDGLLNANAPERNNIPD